jgi:hypothetical protein
MVAEGIERIDVETGTIGGGKALTELDIKDFVAKALALDQILRGLRKGDAEEGSLSQEWVGGYRSHS